MPPEEPSLSQENVFDILSSGRRRYVIYVLRREQRPMKVTELAEEVAAWENETTVDELSTQERKRVYVSLYQTHIPKLVDAGIVEHDEDSSLVALTEDASDIDRYLVTSDSESSFSWPYLYLPMALLGGAVAVLTAFNVSVFASVPNPVVGFVLFGGLLAAVSAHLLYRYTERTEIPPELERRR
jgi:hypothetical protein